ncbi:hypothetical protein [Mycobacterium phage WXIN]|nr:hypothetical protein [Mycobacterium phage WXIN]
MKDSEVVAAARELISDPESWIQGDWCVGAPSQVKMCAEGAVRIATGWCRWSEPVGGWWYSNAGSKADQSDRVEATLARVAFEMFPSRIADQWGEDADPLVLNSYNDAKITQHKDVLAIFDETHRRLIKVGE